jgi:L-threonylcarbamoyladenylate synthase
MLTVTCFGAQGKVIKIGALFNQTGDQSSLDVPGLNGFKLAAELINKSGGVLGRKIEVDAIEATVSAIEAPGQLASHYAPSKPLRLNATQAEPDEYLIGFGGVSGDATLTASGDLVEAAARLFDLLHQADASDRARIAVAPVPSAGLGAAINDRLKRAAHP